MSVIRNQVKGKFSIIENHIITDSRISDAAFRVACYLISRPDNWQINNKDIMKQLRIKQQDTLAKYWKQLLNAGVLFRREKPKVGGRFVGYDYAIGGIPDDWQTTPGSTGYGATDNGETGVLNKTDPNNTDPSNISNSKESNASRGTLPEGNAPKNEKSPHKEKKESTRRLYQNQIDADEFPYVSETLKRLNAALAEHESKGMTHKFAMDKRRHELTVNPDHLNDMESNLSELGCYADDGEEYGYVFSKLIKLYNARAAKSKTAKVNLAFLAGVNMPWFEYGMGSDEYVKWVNEFVLVED